MFYSPVYLKKTGRFGLIWLAATQTKILSKRELAAINVSRTCSDIFTHIPGLQKDRGSRASRFSLYLCCQLMYGSVRILQRQWEFLLVDTQALFKRCTDNPSTTKDIDMATTRQAACIESNVPRDAKDANLDPYFGAIKEATIDVESMLVYLEALSENRMLRLEPLPMPVIPEIGSPHSVSDPKEIQIQDAAMFPMMQISARMSGEADLPKMDIAAFLSISHDESFQEIQERLGVVEERQTNEMQMVLDEQMLLNHSEHVAMTETEDRNVSMMRDILMDCLPQTDVMGQQLLPLEETPLAKPTSGMPGPPHKPKLDGPKRQRGPNKKGSRFQDICNGNLKPDQDVATATVIDQTSSDDSYLLRQQQKEREKDQEADEKGHGHDWAQKNAPVIELAPIAVSDSPLRKKRPHKLVIDQFLMISRQELKQQMKDTSDIVVPMELPNTTKDKNIYREPSLDYLKSKAFAGLFTRNCKFGLRMEDTGSEQESQHSPRLLDFLSRKRARAVMDEAETPANKIPRHSTVEAASMEIARGRATGSLSESIDKNLSHSLVEEESILKRLSTSTRGHPSFPMDMDTSKEGSILERDMTGGILTTWPEEPELRQIISPVRHLPELAVESDLHVQSVAQTSVTDGQGVIATEKSPQQDPAIVSHPDALDSALTNSSDTPRTTVYKLVENNLRSSDDWTTFMAICPPSACSRKVAAAMFNALCTQIARGKLSVRQDEPYSSIFIWVPERVSGISASSE